MRCKLIWLLIKICWTFDIWFGGPFWHWSNLLYEMYNHYKYSPYWLEHKWTYRETEDFWKIVSAHKWNTWYPNHVTLDCHEQF